MATYYHDKTRLSLWYPYVNLYFFWRVISHDAVVKDIFIISAFIPDMTSRLAH